MEKPLGAEPTPVPEFKAGYGRPILSDLHTLLDGIDTGIIGDMWRVREYLAGVINRMHERETETKEMVEYGYLADRNDPRFYENQHPQQHDTTTATVWALHLNLPSGTGAERAAARDAILARMSGLPEPTGEYTFGDSWEEWGEPIKSASDAHMVVYFRAAPDRAASIGHHLANHATFAVIRASKDLPGISPVLPYAVSTSGDYAEQITTLP